MQDMHCGDKEAEDMLQMLKLTKLVQFCEGRTC